MNQHPVYRFDDFVVDPERWRLTRSGLEIHLKPAVLKLLIYLIANRGRLVTRDELMDTVWGDTVISESALTKAMARLRKALGDDSATHRYLETVRSQGYRFIAEVEEVERPDSIDLQPGKARAASRRRVMLGSAAAAIALVMLAVFWDRGLQDENPQAQLIGSLAVLPLSNLTGDPEQAYYADGLQDLLITELSQLRGLRVTSRQSTKRYRDSQLPATDIAGELGVDALVEGSLLGKGGTIEVAVQVIDGRSDAHLWAERYKREAPYVFNMVGDMAAAIGAEIGATTLPPGDEGPIDDRRGPIDPRAIDAYALGSANLDRFTRDGIRTAIEQLQTAVSLEPDFAPAWARLAAAHAMQGLYGFAPPRDALEKGWTAALAAVEADEQFYGGHSALGWGRLWTGDFEGACELFAEALRLNPSGPAAIHGEADCLMLEGRWDESIARLREILMISPFSAGQSVSLPYHLYVARHFDEAIAAAKDMQSRVPRFSMHWFFALVYWQQGRFDEAFEEERLELERRGDTVLLAALDGGFEAEGPTGAMRAKAEAQVARANETYVEPFDIAESFARAGMVDETLHWLEKAVEYGSYKMTYLAFWPHFDLVRNDPRYQDLLERVYGEKAEEIGRAADSTGLGTSQN